MFKVESYITPLILSYVDKYIKNFRPEDSQVSLWGGDVSFHNLDLRLEVLEQELQLPFSFVSGHIHELLIHVPWTKLTSEPISITINTIECILKLRTADNARTPEPPKEKAKKSAGKKNEEPPPGYIQSLINKIVSNIRIYCNNLILKYVEEDIVLSMNVKLLTYESCNEQWQPTYSDYSPVQVTMRKLITVNDLTVCLDKRSASGKIEVYQEPMLYRCSLVMHFLRTYHSSNIAKASTTRFDIYCNNMEFSMTELQIPMVIRLVLLACTLTAKDYKSEHDVKINEEPTFEVMAESSDATTSWAGWLWSFVPSIRSSADEQGGDEQPVVPTGHTLHTGFYVDTASLVFKVSESSNERSYYSQRKLKYWPLLLLKIQGLYLETVMHGLKWINARAGIGNIEIQPLGSCACGFIDVLDNNFPQHYFSAGTLTENHKTDSLFDAEAVENNGQRKLYNVSWDYHLSHVTESTLLDRTAAFAADFVHEVIVPDDITSEELSDIGSNFECSNISVRTLVRVIVGPIRMTICSGLIHRAECMAAAASAYDYAPYTVERSPQPSRIDLQPPSTDDYDALNANVPRKVVQLTIIAPVIEVSLFDHPKFQATKDHLFRKRKKLPGIASSPSQNYLYLPKLTIECQCIDTKTEGPIYTKKLVNTVCQLPDPPVHMFNACYKTISVKVLNFCSKLIMGSNKNTTIITPFNATFTNRTVISPGYWTNPDTPHNEMIVKSDSIGINCTKPKAVLVGMIIEKMIKKDCEEAMHFIANTSILQDAMKPYRACLEFCIEDMRLHKVSTKTTLCMNISLGSIKAFIFDPSEKSSLINTKPHNSYEATNLTNVNVASNHEIQQVLFISGPDFRSTDIKGNQAPLLTCSLQFPLDPVVQAHPSIVMFNLQEVRVCVDPLLCRWFLYTPTIMVQLKTDYSSDIKKIKASSEATVSSVSGMETPRRLTTTHESVHSSSDRDREFLQIPRTPRETKEEELPDPQERIYNFLTKWFTVWKGMMLFGDLSQCTIYFPTESLSAVGSQGIQQAIDRAMLSDTPPDILIITLPNGTIRSAGNKDNILPHIRTLPIKLPPSLWSSNKTNFPWSISISDISCYSWQRGAKLDLLKPVSLNATVGMCAKSKQGDSGNMSESDSIVKDSQKEEATVSQPAAENKSLGTLGICVHIDMSPTKIIVSEVQVCLVASIMYGLLEVMNNLAPNISDQSRQPDILPVINVQPSSAASPTILKESTLDSTSEQSPRITINTDNIDTDNIKLTAWIQWTITKFTIEMLSYRMEDMCKEDFNYMQPLTLKLVVEAEDVVSSLDFQSVYLKIKSKIGAASIQHYFWDWHKGQWQPGPYLGFIMKTKEEILSQDRREDTCFANIIVTRASCRHTHDLWGTSKKTKVKEKENENPLPQLDRFITEIVVTLQPIDFLLSLSTLRSFYIVFEPLLQIPSSPHVAKETDIIVNINNRVLPLAYVECKGFRIIIPSVELGTAGVTPDVCIFQVNGINLIPDPVNPICRTPIRADIYQQAARSRILNIPGSEIEDRQYELKVSGICLSTSSWADFDPVLNLTSASTKQLKTMSENPALEWNLGKGSIMKGQQINLVPIIHKFDILIVTAPAMIYKSEVICGHSIEINFVTSIETLISLSQIKLLLALQNEFNSMFDMCATSGGVSKRPKVYLPYMMPKLGLTEITELLPQPDVGKDSGFETPEFRSLISFKTTTEILHLKRIHASENIFTKPSVMCPYGYIPLDLLLTAGKVSFMLYNQTKDNVKEIMQYGTRKQKMLTTNMSTAFEEVKHGTETVNTKKHKYNPYIFVSICQPNLFMSDLQLGRKIQVSCFDIKVKLPASEKAVVRSIPVEKDFTVNLVETRSGYPNPHNGVLPAFFTMRWSKGVGKPNLELEVAKPVQVVASAAICTHLIQIENKFVEAFPPDDVVVKKSIPTKTVIPGSTVSVSRSRVLKHQKSVDNYTKFKDIKDKLFGVSIFNVKLAQFVFKIKTETDNELTFIVGKIKNHLNISNRPERITNITCLSCISLGVSNGYVSQLLLNPWTISLEVCLFWESWQSADSDPQIQISAESECIVVDISPDQLQCISVVTKDMTDFINSLPLTKNNAEPPIYEDVQKTIAGDKEQHYKDDLRAGAFHFVDSTSNNIDELPLPYQVMFWNKNISAMAWRYPQPRALTKIRVFPVPFKVTQDSNETQRILCHLEYWSDCHASYQPYMQFYLSESEMFHLDLPQNNQPAVACTWRIVLSSGTHDDDEYSNYTRVLLSPRALAGCIRVDSYFNKVLVPQLTLALHISTIAINLYNRIDKSKNFIMPDALKHYTPDQLFPEVQNFMTITLDNTRAYLATWNFDVFSFDLTSHIKCLVLDYAFLTMQPLILPSIFKFEASICNSINVNFISKPISINFGATAAHTMAVSTQLWSEFFTNNENSMHLIVMTQYVVCNDTNVTLRFGQAGYEDILLLPHQCHLYAWRSQKCKLMLRVALEEYGWIWSEPFRIDCDGTEVLNISKENNVVLIMTVKSLSATQKKITFSGQLVICNTLLEHFELKVIEIVESHKDKAFKTAPVHIISRRSTPPSILIDSNKKYHLRLRFYGLESAWSGDIPLAANPKCAQPWLVKVPLQERGQFLSIWCQIETQHFDTGCKILAILSPLFMVRSNLPINSKVHIETPTLHVHLESTVRGKGEYQQLYCPGTIDHSHQLTFQLDDTPTSNPYVPLNYSLVDQKEFFKKKENVNIDEILDVLSNYDKSSWPYFGEDYEGIDLLIEEQPLTHVQVRYQNACLYSSALLVELLPWCLLLNTVGCAIAIIINEKELCRVSHYGICTPPKLEETFYLGVGINGMWNLTPPLQLAKSNWSTAFCMPKISGNIPLEGNIKTMVKSEPYVCTISISSHIENAIRLLRVSSTHVLTNHTSLELYGACFAVPVTGTTYNFPKKIEKHAFSVVPNLHLKSAGVSLTRWYVIGKTIDPTIEYVFYISFSSNGNSGWTCPVRVDKPFNRRSICIQADQKSIPIVLVSQEDKGQSFLSLHYDTHPQLHIKNRTGVRLFCAQFADNESQVIVEDCEHMKWLCSIDDESSCYYTMPDQSVLFPDVALNADHLVFASDPEGDPQGFQWSQPVNVSNFNDQFIRIPYYGDIKASITSTAHTTILFLESVTQVEISARDIRVRLSMHENECSGALLAAPRLPETADVLSIPSTYFSAAEEITPDNGNKNLICHSQTLPTLAEHSNLNMEFSNSPASSDYDLCKDPMRNSKTKCGWNNFKAQIFVKAVIVTLTSDLENCGAEKMEFCSLICDNIALIVNRTDNVDIQFSISDIQIDNQLYFRDSYDFPVILISQQVPQNQPLNSLNVPVNQLIMNSQRDALVNVVANLEVWTDPVRQVTVTDMTEVYVNIKPLAVYIEDSYILKLVEQMSILSPSNLIMWRTERNATNKFDASAMLIYVPLYLAWGSDVYAGAVSIRSFVIEPISILLSAHCSMKLYVALDESPLEFGKFDKKKIVTTSYRLGNAITMHYLSGAIFGAGWVVGSLELLGSPSGLARAMGVGLKDFVSLPYQGLLQGPWAFLVGITHGVASLMMHVTAGTVQSVTKLASSVARNLDRMTLDEEHLRRTEEQRRQRPQSVAQGLFQGLTGFGINLLGAIGGIAHHPLQSLTQAGASPRSVAAGVGLGLVGILTKPLSGAADLVALTGQGLLQGAGWNTLPDPRTKPTLSHVFSSVNSVLKYSWKFMPPVTKPNVLFVTEATSISAFGQYEAVALILTTEILIIVNTNDDMTQKIIKLEELYGIDSNSDPTLLTLKLVVTKPETSKTKLDECPGELDPVSKARIQDYVRNTVGFITFSDASSQHSEISISPDISVEETVEEAHKEQTSLNFYVNPQSRNYFLCLLSLAKQQQEAYNFPVL